MLWCVTLQELLLYVDWSPELLRQPHCMTERDEEGWCMFRGPRCVREERGGVCVWGGLV